MALVPLRLSALPHHVDLSRTCLVLPSYSHNRKDAHEHSWAYGSRPRLYSSLSPSLLRSFFVSSCA
jgi:hypothetical protein